MNADCLAFVHRQIMPIALGLLPARMNTPEARAMLIAIALQESRFEHRIQVPNGPARGFWQFERGGGVHGVLTHRVTEPLIVRPLHILNYEHDATVCYMALAHNDVLACVFARLLLWTLPYPLPGPYEPERAYTQYVEAWRPGKPHPDTWAEFYVEGWRRVNGEAHVETS